MFLIKIAQKMSGFFLKVFSANVQTSELAILVRHLESFLKQLGDSIFVLKMPLEAPHTIFKMLQEYS
jgi:hypothetical protein